MEPVDHLSSETVKPGPLKAVFNRMLNKSNLDPSLKPPIVNDAIVTDEKIQFAQRVLTTYEQRIHVEYSDDREVRDRLLGEIADLTMFLTGEGARISAENYDEKPRIDNKLPRNRILEVASLATRAYSAAMLEQAKDKPTPEPSGNLEDLSEAREVIVEPLKDLNNTIFDLYEAKAIERAYAEALLLLFGIARSSSSPEFQKSKLLVTRRKLKRDIDLSPELNHSKKQDPDLEEAKKYILMLVSVAGRSPNIRQNFKTMADLEVLATMSHDEVETSKARAYVESRIADGLLALYSKD